MFKGGKSSKLFKAYESKDTEAMRKHLKGLTGSQFKETRDASEHTLLHKAAVEGNVEVVNLLSEQEYFGEIVNS